MTSWPTIVSDLLGAGFDRPGLASAVGAGVSTINELARGVTREPRHALGQRLLALHAQHCQRAGRNRKGSAVKKRV
jgi:hypothetical protein